MTHEQAYFGLMFENGRTPSEKKAAFAQDMVNRLRRAATEPYTGLADAVERPLLKVQLEIGQIDSSLQRQKTQTRDANTFLKSFRDKLKNDEALIASALGGFDTNGYKEFFPNGGYSEYSDAPKKSMLRLFQRLGAAATEHSRLLPAELVQRYTGLEAGWKACNVKTTQSRKDTKENRNERTEARQELDIACHVAGHTIATLHPGNIDRCLEFINLSLLDTPVSTPAVPATTA
ncbi:MAG: hypothetical protein EOO11_02995 [Chitinophagaceae bacterium]|nr:MAG: hypothetical protein EOO11_02995 [Chitinophagaceae bacterium]